MRVGMPVYEGVDLLDVAGPCEMLGWADIEVVLIARKPGLIPCRGGVAIAAQASFADAPPCEILWTPGGSPEALRALMRDRAFLDFLVARAATAQYVCSVCEGALLLAAAGLLDGYEITTHWAFEACFGKFPKVRLASGHPRYVLDRNRLTGGGISAGLEEALKLIELVKGKDASDKARLYTQFFPEAVPSTIPSQPPACPVWS